MGHTNDDEHELSNANTLSFNLSEDVCVDLDELVIIHYKSTLN